MTAPGVVQACNGHKRPVSITLHYRIDRSQRCTHHIRGDIEHARECGGITTVEKTATFLRLFGNKVDVLGRMKKCELVDGGTTRQRIFDG